MSHLAAHLLPTLESLGVWSYWIVALAAFLESWWVTGVVAPGTLVVDAGGALVRLGYLHFFDLAWFVALGAILGGEVSWHTGRWLGSRLSLPKSRAFTRAQELVRKRGALALLIGRFLGPVSSFAPLAAAMTGMPRRRFVTWNIISGLAYALSHVLIGYAAGDVLARLQPYLPRLILPLALLAGLIAVTWVVTRQVQRGLPALLAALSALKQRLLAWPVVIHLAARHPGVAGFISRRLDPGHGRGLMTTAVVALLLYLIGVFIDGAMDVALVPDTVALDQRVAHLAQAYWTPLGLSIAGWATQAGHVPVAMLVAFAGVLGLLVLRRPAASAGLAASVIGNAVTVTLLKLAFGRARPEISYFLETSNSFPSGHAAISVALYACLFLMLWRERLIGPTTALTGAVGIAAALGLTRIYLVEHYLSDVLNGWVVGAIWMVIGLALAEGLRGRRSALSALLSEGPAKIARALSAVAMLVCLGGALWFALHHDRTPAEARVTPPAPIADLDQALRGGGIARQVVTLSGEELPPVAMVVTGLSPAQAEARLLKNGWQQVPSPDALSVIAALRSDLTDRLQAGATVPLAFRASRPAAVTLRLPAAESVLRIWPVGQMTDGRAVLAVALAPEQHSEARHRRWTTAAAAARAADALGGSRSTIQLAPARGVTDRTGAHWSFDGALLRLDVQPG